MSKLCLYVCVALLRAPIASARSPSELFDSQWQAEDVRDILTEPIGLKAPEPFPQRGRALWSNATAPFKYNGGQVMTGNVAVTMIYLGFTANDTVPKWLNWYYSTDPATNVKTYATGNINLTASWYYDSTFAKTYSVNTTGTEAQVIYNYLSKIISLRNVVPTNNDIYIFVAADGVIPRVRNCSITRFGAWHSVMTRYNPGSSIPTYVKYAFIPQDPCWSFARTDPATGKLVRNPGYSPYGYDPAMSPTGDPSTDSMASVLAHEVMETVTDPGSITVSPGWFGNPAKYEEAADVCTGFYPYPLLQTKMASGTVRQYTQMVNGFPFIFPLSYLPVASPATGVDYGCVFGVNAALVVQQSTNDNTRNTWYNYRGPIPPRQDDDVIPG